MPPIHSKTRVYTGTSVSVYGGDPWRTQQVTIHPFNDDQHVIAAR